MKNSGFQKLMKSAIVGTAKLLTGKKFPINARAPRFVVVELLRGFVDAMVCREDFDQFF